MIFLSMEVIGRQTQIVVMVISIIITVSLQYLISTAQKFEYLFFLFRLDIGNQCTGSPSTDWNCCSVAFPCAMGGGDCDNDDQCQGNMICGADNCARDFSSNGHSPNWASGADCCKGNIR